ncbi:hypothetical protein FRC01_010241, partial [Tulasnella sp. 417]
HGDLWLIAACWVALIHYKDRTVGKRITGIIGQFMRMVDGSGFEEWNNEKRKNEKGKAKEECQGPSGSASVVRPQRPQEPKPYYPPKSKQSQGGYGSPGPSYSGSNPGSSMPPTRGSSSNSGSYFPQVTPAPPPPPPSQPYQPPPSQQHQPLHPNSVPAAGQPSNFELYNKPFGGTGPMAHSEPDKIEPMHNLGASAMNTRFENTSTPPPRDIHEPLQVSRGSSGNFSSVEASQTFFPVTVDPPSRATTSGDPFSDSRRVVDIDPHELSEVGSGSAADISGSTASGDLLVHVEASQELRVEEHHRDDDRLAREMKDWASCKHPNILEFWGFHLSEDFTKAYLVSPYMVNGNVQAYIAREAPPQEVRLALIVDTITGLDYLHKRDPPVVHGDLKT